MREVFPHTEEFIQDKKEHLLTRKLWIRLRPTGSSSDEILASFHLNRVAPEVDVLTLAFASKNFVRETISDTW